MYIPKKITNNEIANNRSKVWLQNKWLKVIEKEFLEKNWQISNFLVLSSNRQFKIWTLVVPITKDQEIVYIKEFRAWPEKIIISFPVWWLDDWLTEIENCKKELNEETWFDSNNIEYLTKTVVHDYFEWEDKFYIARDCVKVWNQHLWLGENIKVFKTSINNFEKMIIKWEVESTKTAYAFLLAKAKWLI